MKALVIGGSQGFGKEIVKNLEKRGYGVITVGRSKLKKKNHYVCDVGNITKWEKTLNKIKEENKKIDFVACIVGFARAKPFEKLNSKDWNEHINKNLLYVAMTFNKIIPKRAITIGSQWSLKVGSAELVPYTVTKHALATLTTNIALINKGLIINHYCVPTMGTPQYLQVKNSFNKLGKIEIIKRFNSGILSDYTEIAEKIIDKALNNPKSGCVDVSLLSK